MLQLFWVQLTFCLSHVLLCIINHASLLPDSNHLLLSSLADEFKALKALFPKGQNKKNVQITHILMWAHGFIRSITSQTLPWKFHWSRRCSLSFFFLCIKFYFCEIVTCIHFKNEVPAHLKLSTCFPIYFPISRLPCFWC